MRSVSSPSFSPPQGFHALRRPQPETTAQTIGAPTTPAVRSASNTATSTDSASFSPDSQALLDQPEAQQKKVLSLLDEMFGISNVTSMSLKIDVSHAHSLQTSSHEQQQSSASGLTYDYHDSSQESDYTALKAAGTITLDDGRSFNLDLSYERAVVVTNSRSLSLSSDTPTSDTATPADISGTGKRLLDQFFTPEKMAGNLADALRNFTHVSQPDSPPSSTDALPGLIASLEASVMSTQSINAVFSHLRDLKQQRQADTYQADKGRSAFDAMSPVFSAFV